MESVLTWVLTAMSLTGIVLNIKKNRKCFLIWIVANMGWIVVNLRHGIQAQALLFVVYTGMSIWGFVEWGRHPPRDDAKKAES
ncbi:MAG: nicotinamide mononucleotide transporter [Desulfovibrionaceae bacterium]